MESGAAAAVHRCPRSEARPAAAHRRLEWRAPGRPGKGPLYSARSRSDRPTAGGEGPGDRPHLRRPSIPCGIRRAPCNAKVAATTPRQPPSIASDRPLPTPQRLAGQLQQPGLEINCPFCSSSRKCPANLSAAIRSGAWPVAFTVPALGEFVT
jgi:hypothetical protein